MENPEFSIVASSEAENAWVDAKIDEFNRKDLSFTGKQLEIPMNYVVKEQNLVVAGIKSCFYLGEVVSIGVLFVDEKFRNKGLGRDLLCKVENEARIIGAKLAHLYAFDQTKDFYLNHGYEIFAVLENCPKAGHKCYYLKKNLMSCEKELEMHDAIIREMQEKDIDRLIESFCFPWSSVKATTNKWKQYYEEHEKHIRTVYLLKKQGQMIGYASLLRNSNYPNFKNNGIPEINDVWISADHRGKGFGKKLIQYLEKMAHHENHSQIGIGVGLYKDYGRAQKLYIGLGYVPDGEGATYKGEHVIPGDSYPLDDDLLIWLKKDLS